MNLALLGGTGRTGRHLIDLALEHGHTVRVLTRGRHPLHHTHGRLTPIIGDARDAHAIAHLVTGCDAVLSALGPAAAAPDDTMTLAAQHLQQALPHAGIRRLITLTGAGVTHPGDTPTPVDRLIRTLLALTQPRALQDATTHTELIRQSTLDWTVVRVPRLTEGPARPVQAGRVGTIKPFVTRASVAQFMLDQLTEGTFIRQAPAISN